jgi:hypothetical protein
VAVLVEAVCHPFGMKNALCLSITSYWGMRPKL